MNCQFKTRGIIVHPEEFDAAQLELVSAARLNSLGLHPVGGRDAAMSLERAIAAHSLPENRALRAEAAARGISVYYEAHALSWLLPRSLFGAHSNWFRMNERGERTPDFNLCPSNPDALSYLGERAALLASLLGGSNRYTLWLDDVSGFSCHCPDCRRLSPSDQQLRAVNAMLAGLRARDKNAELSYIAYNDALDAPRRVEPLDGVFLEYAPINRDSHRPLNDAECPQNARELAPLGDLLACFGVERARVLEYWMDNSRFSGWQKPPKRFELDEATLEADLEFYASKGFTDVTSFGCYLGADYRALYGEAPIARYGEGLRR